MRIAMFSNAYAPRVGGVTRSIQSFTRQLRQNGHEVLIVAPQYSAESTDDENQVIRVPAIPRFYKGTYPLPIKIPGYLWKPLVEFQPQVIHAHQPFFLGGAARTTSAIWNLPLVYTHHTRFTQYLDLHQSVFCKELQALIESLTIRYCRACDAVIAPSQSMARVLASKCIDTEIKVIPTGVDLQRFSQGNGQAVRDIANIPQDAFVVGHVGRLSCEKNLPFLAAAVVAFLKSHPQAHFLVVGKGEHEQVFHQVAESESVDWRIHRCGVLEGERLVDAYHAMDVFAFASQSETQGLVLAEAMAAKVPVLALDAPGVRDIVADGVNGRLLREEAAAEFADTLGWFAHLSPTRRSELHAACEFTAADFSIARSGERVLGLYERVMSEHGTRGKADEDVLPLLSRTLKSQWRQWVEVAQALGKAILT